MRCRSHRGASMEFDKTRFRFEKAGDLRFLSHHDLMRTMERMLRRANLPFRSTEGFHPSPRVIFALSLSLGIAGLDEVLEIEWTQPVEPLEATQRLQATAPDGLVFLSARRVPLKSTARVCRTLFELRFESSSAPDGLADRVEWLQSQPFVVVERTRPSKKLLDIKPFIRGIRLNHNRIEFDFWAMQDGTARADELIRLLNLQDEIEQGAYLRRSRLFVLDELDPDEQSQVPHPDSIRTAFKGVEPLLRALPENVADTVTPSLEWGVSPSGPVVE
jgi:radical SAM-linked protein